MRRITTWVMSTLSALVLLFSYHTSTSSKAATSIHSMAVNGSVNSSAGATTDSSASSSGTPTTSSGSASTGATTGTSGSSSSGSASSGSSSSGSSSGSSGSSSGSTASGSTAAAKTYTGTGVMMQYGTVQVQITVAGGKITKSVVTQVPWDNPRDQEINSQAVPILNSEVLQAQSAQIDMVSGATFTSAAYTQSLQSALDQAHL